VVVVPGRHRQRPITTTIAYTLLIGALPRVRLWAPARIRCRCRWWSHAGRRQKRGTL